MSFLANVLHLKRASDLRICVANQTKKLKPKKWSRCWLRSNQMRISKTQPKMKGVSPRARFRYHFFLRALRTRIASIFDEYYIKWNTERQEADDSLFIFQLTFMFKVVFFLRAFLASSPSFRVIFLFVRMACAHLPMPRNWIYCNVSIFGVDVAQRNWMASMRELWAFVRSLVHLLALVRYLRVQCSCRMVRQINFSRCLFILLICLFSLFSASTFEFV